MSPLQISGHFWASLGQSFVGSLLLSPGSWCAQGSVCALQESVSQSCVSSGGSMVGLIDLPQEGLCHTQVCCTQSPRPSGRPLLTHTSARDTQTPKGRSGSVSVGSLGPIEGLLCVKKFYKHFTAMNSYNLHSDPVV